MLRKLLAGLVLLLALGGLASAAMAAPAEPLTERWVLDWAGRLHLGGWRYLGFNEHEVLFVTDGSNKLHPPYLRFWIRSERFGGDEAGARSSKRLVEVDCREHRWTMLDSRAYAGSDLKGPLVTSGQSAPWREVADPDLMHALAFVCLGR